MIQITADTRRAVVTNKELLTKGSAGIQVRFTLSEDWAGLAKVAVFRQGDDGERVDCVLDSGLTCVVPSEVLTIEDEVVFCGVYGSNGQGTIIIPTIWASLGVVRPGTEPNTPATATPTSEIWAQILNVAQNAEGTANEAYTMAENAQGYIVEKIVTDAVDNFVENTVPAAIQGIEEKGTAQVNRVQTKGDEVIDSIPQDYSKLVDDVADLNRQLNQVYLPSENIYNRNADRHGITIDGNGVISENASYKASDYIYVGAGNKVTINVVNANELIRFFYYTTNDASGFSRALWTTEEGAKTLALSSTEQYIVILMRDECPDYMVNLGTSLLPYAPYGGEAGSFLAGLVDGIHSEIATSAESVRNTSAQKEIVNRFNKETITAGKYIATSDGDLVTSEDFFASDFIYIGDLASVTVSYTHIFVWYDENKNHLTPNPDPMNSISQDLTFTRPEGAVYLRFSTYNARLNSAQIGGDVSRNNYVPYGVYKLPELRINESQIEVSDDSRIIVDASGAGDYTSFTQAIYDTVDSGKDVYVKPGTYDIVAEYIALFGQSAVDSMADSDSAIFNGFQYGVRLRKRKVEFAPGAHLVCDWTGHTVDGTHRFSALGIDYDVKIIGLDLDATATFYCIHDDYGLWYSPYTVEYENCRIIGHNIYNANCIGGGCEKYSRHIINNCYFDNNLTNSATVRYHNTNGEGSEPEIYVSNCYFNNWFTPRWYGTQTSKMRVYVNNCHARAIFKMAESSSYDVDNIELYKWNNEETDPTT